MGSGKTSWAIQEMNTHQEKNFIFITPFLSEIQRIKDSTESKFFDPKNFGQGKLSSLNSLLSCGCNIVSTHALFSRASEETQQLLSQGKYTLILDEVLDVVEQYSDLKKGDVDFLIKENLISIDPSTGYISWNKNKQYSDYKYDDTMLLANNRSLVYIDGTIVLWQFPPMIFDLFKHVYIMTYQFDGQIMRAYFDFHQLPYEFKSVQKTGETYALCNYQSKNEAHDLFRRLINICSDSKLNAIGCKPNALSVTWYKNTSKNNLAVLKANMINYFTNKVHAKSSSIMWTTFKDYRNKLTGRGYTKALLKCDLPDNLSDDDFKRSECFVPINCRATNLYSERCNIAYMVNRYPMPYIKKFFALRNVAFNDELFALSEMVQWIWRSAIRNHQPINLYIPSSRMRGMLISWLNEEALMNSAS